MRIVLAFLLMVAAAQAGGPNWFSPKPPIPNPSNSTGLKPDGGKKAPGPDAKRGPQGATGPRPPSAPVKPLFRFNHSKTECPGCLPAAEFFRLYGKGLPCEIEDSEYENLNHAAENGVQFVPSLDLLDKQGVTVETFGFNPYIGRRMKHGVVEQFCNHNKQGLCPLCIRGRIRELKAKQASFSDRHMRDHVTAAKPATLPIKSQVQQAFAVLKQAKIGTFSAAIHSNDGKRSVRVMGGNQTAISILAVCGSSGSFVLDAPGSLIPDGRLDFGYRMSGPNRGELNIRVPFDLDPSPKAAAVKQACGFGPFEILSAFTTIFKILNASAEVALPADIALTGSFNGSRIATEFVQGKSPLVVINHLWTTERRFVGAEATESEAVIRSTVPFKKVVRVLFN